MKKGETAKKTKTNATEIVRAVLKHRKVKQKYLALMVGRSATTISNLLYSEGLSVSSLYSFMTVLGYEIVIQPKKPGQRPEGQYVVEGVKNAAETDSEEKAPPKNVITLEMLRQRKY